jgi:hypothetical protein
MRKLLLVLGLVAVIFLVMPSAMAKFTGQHQFINGSSVDCERCHTTISNELHAGNAHNWTSSDVGTSPCRVCHIPNPSDNTKGYYNPYGGATATYHAAAMVECLFCHGELNGSSILQGSGSKIIPSANVTQEFEGGNVEAHRPLYYRAKNASGVDTNDMLLGANEACISCHTYGANVTIIEPTQYLNVTANASDCVGWYPGFTGTPDPNCYNDGYSFNWSITFGTNP